MENNNEKLESAIGKLLDRANADLINGQNISEQTLAALMSLVSLTPNII